ncbi:hypothetical protein [Streptomyces sp. NPDC058155]|uniref:hypothetical protein n=1 Tax=Streptomyces sp. NPDC058155 TaxID=3346359 RepID=UPI0036E6F637
MSEKPIIPPPPNYPPNMPARARDWLDDILDNQKTPTGPADPPVGGGRLPDWRTPKPALEVPTEPTVAEREREPEPEQQAEPPADEPEAAQQGGDEDEQPEPAVAAVPTARPAPGPASNKLAASSNSSRWRLVAFNATAAGIGYGLGLVDTLGAYLPAAEQAATGMVGTVMAAAGGVAAWRLTGLPAVDAILPDARTRARLVVTIGAAEVGRRLAPLPVAWLAEHGTNIGLGPNAIALLLTVGGMCGGMWWLIDRHTRTWWWGGRLLLRIPLASALLSTALYAPGLAP